MLKSRVVTVPVQRRFDEAYAILCEPRNYPRWSPIPDALFTAVVEGGLDYWVDVPSGRRILRFSPRNDFGVLDYSVLSEGGVLEYTVPLRLVPNDDCSELIAVFYQRPGVSDAQFESDSEWAANDLKAVATVVEGL